MGCLAVAVRQIIAVLHSRGHRDEVALATRAQSGLRIRRRRQPINWSWNVNWASCSPSASHEFSLAVYIIGADARYEDVCMASRLLPRAAAEQNHDGDKSCPDGATRVVRPARGYASRGAHRSVPITVKEASEALRRSPVLLCVDVDNPIRAELVRDGVQGGHRSGLEPGVTAPDIELSGVVEGDREILGARVDMLRRDDPDSAVVRQVDPTFDRMAIPHDRHQERDRSASETVEASRQIVGTKQDGCRIDDDDGRLRGKAGGPLHERMSDDLGGRRVIAREAVGAQAWELRPSRLGEFCDLSVVRRDDDAVRNHRRSNKGDGARDRWDAEK